MGIGIDRKKLFTQLVGLTFLLFIAHLSAQKFYWYYSIWYFDMPMHAIGGFLSGMFLIWILSYKNLSNEPFLKLILKILLGVFLIGILWEIFEFSANNYTGSSLFHVNKIDSFSDIFFDLSGGLAAILYYLKRIMPSGGNTL